MPEPEGHVHVLTACPAGVGHFVWSTLEDTRPLTKGLLEPITGPYTVGKPQLRFLPLQSFGEASCRQRWRVPPPSSSALAGSKVFSLVS